MDGKNSSARYYLLGLATKLIDLNWRGPGGGLAKAPLGYREVALCQTSIVSFALSPTLTAKA